MLVIIRWEMHGILFRFFPKIFLIGRQAPPASAPRAPAPIAPVGRLQAIDRVEHIEVIEVILKQWIWPPPPPKKKKN